MLSSLVRRCTAAVSNAPARRMIHTTAALRSGPSSVLHTDTPDNNENTPFDFTEENYKEIEYHMSKYPANQKRSCMLPLLHLAQRQHGGWVPLAAMNKIAEILEVAPMRVYEVATFYSMYNREKVGKFHVQFCVTSMCMICGSDEIQEAVEKHLGVKTWETTPDGMITLGEMECMGACANAPMIVVSDYTAEKNFQYRYFEDLDIDSTLKIMDSLRSGVLPPHGSQIGRKAARGIQGKTSLFEDPPGPYCRDLEKC